MSWMDQVSCMIKAGLQMSKNHYKHQAYGTLEHVFGMNIIFLWQLWCFLLWCIGSFHFRTLRPYGLKTLRWNHPCKLELLTLKLIPVLRKNRAAISSEHFGFFWGALTSACSSQQTLYFATPGWLAEPESKKGPRDVCWKDGQYKIHNKIHPRSFLVGGFNLSEKY